MTGTTSGAYCQQWTTIRSATGICDAIFKGRNVFRFIFDTVSFFTKTSFPLITLSSSNRSARISFGSISGSGVTLLAFSTVRGVSVVEEHGEV